MKNEKNNSIAIFLLLSIFLGMISGAVSSFIIRSYVFGDMFTMPFAGEMDLSSGNYRGSSLVISGAKKVVVEQSDKIASTIESSRSSLVGIFKKKTLPEVSSLLYFDQKDFYRVGEEISQGLIITSDGWVITDFKPDNLNYVAITSDKRILPIDKVVKDTLTPFYFVHIVASDLPVKGFADISDVRGGDLVLSVDWSGRGEISYISDIRTDNSNPVSSSDYFYKKIKLSDNLSEDFKGLTVFNLSGDVVGLINEEGVEPITHFDSAIKSLLKSGSVVRTSLGVNYVDLSYLIGSGSIVSEKNGINNGALVYDGANGAAVTKGSAADLAGIRKGDIITAIDNIEINKKISLSEAVQKFSKGDKIIVVLLRNAEKMEVEVELK